MPEQKYMSYRSEDCFGNSYNHNSIKDGLGGDIGSMPKAMKQYNKSENKRKKYLKDLKKQNKTIYRISKKSGSRRELKNI